jgi:hypothetical protein
MPSPGGAASVLLPAAKCRVQAAAAAAGGSAACPTPALFIVVTLLKLKTPQDFIVVAQAYKQAVARIQPGELPGGGASRVRLLTAHPTISLQAGMATLSKHPENGCQSNFRWQPAAEASQLHANASTMATRNAFSLAAHTILPSTPPAAGAVAIPVALEYEDKAIAVHTVVKFPGKVAQGARSAEAMYGKLLGSVARYFDRSLFGAAHMETVSSSYLVRAAHRMQTGQANPLRMPPSRHRLLPYRT